jgi:hypothetical protein
MLVHNPSHKGEVSAIQAPRAVQPRLDRSHSLKEDLEAESVVRRPMPRVKRSPREAVSTDNCSKNINVNLFLKIKKKKNK